MTSIQIRLIKMAEILSSILEGSNISYMITLGTLLGAVRHKGFIPWDTDFDIHLFDESYEDAIEVLRNNLPKWMFLEDEKSEPLYFHGWAHVKDLNSRVKNTGYPQDVSYSHHGISLDLYRLHRTEGKNVWKYINDENEKYLLRRKEKGLISDDEYRVRFEKLCNDRRLESELLVDGNADREVYAMVSKYKQKYLEIDDIFPLRKYEFEQYQFYGPNNADNILRSVYGNYMELPSQERIDRRMSIEVEMW